MSRRVTVSGRAPPSLIENRRPPGELRSKKSWITASQIRAEAGYRRRDLDQTFVVRQHALDQNLEIAGGVDARDGLTAIAACALLRRAVHLKLLHVSAPTSS